MRTLSNQPQGFFSYTTSGVSIEQAWNKHQEYIQQIAAEQHTPFKAHSFEEFVKLSEREDLEFSANPNGTS